MEEASWVQASQFSHPKQLQDYLKEDNPEEKEDLSDEDITSIRGE